MKDRFYIKQCEEAMQLDRIKDMLGKSYWAKDRSVETIEKSIENSRCYGAFSVDDHKQIGFARVITDYATFYYICDVIVDEDYRGNSIGKELVQAIVSDEALQLSLIHIFQEAFSRGSIQIFLTGVCAEGMKQQKNILILRVY